MYNQDWNGFLCCYKKLVANMHYAKESLLYIYIYIISNVSNENSTIFFKNSKGKFVKIFFLIKIIKGKLQLTYMWFDWNLSCLPVVWNLTFYLLKVNLIRFLKSISVKTKVKYIILLHFYISFLQKHKNTRSNKKKKSNGTLASWDFKPQVGNLNFSQTSGG